MINGREKGEKQCFYYTRVIGFAFFVFEILDNLTSVSLEQ